MQPTDNSRKQNHVPTRTSSAPPEEHPSDTKSPNFQPTKTGQTLDMGHGAVSYKNVVKASTVKSEGASTTEAIPTAPVLETPSEPETKPTATAGEEGHNDVKDGQEGDNSQSGQRYDRKPARSRGYSHERQQQQQQQGYNNQGYNKQPRGVPMPQQMYYNPASYAPAAGMVPVQYQYMQPTWGAYGYMQQPQQVDYATYNAYMAMYNQQAGMMGYQQAPRGYAMPVQQAQAPVVQQQQQQQQQQHTAPASAAPVAPATPAKESVAATPVTPVAPSTPQVSAPEFVPSAGLVPVPPSTPVAATTAASVAIVPPPAKSATKLRIKLKDATSEMSLDEWKKNAPVKPVSTPLEGTEASKSSSESKPDTPVEVEADLTKKSEEETKVPATPVSASVAEEEAPNSAPRRLVPGSGVKAATRAAKDAGHKKYTRIELLELKPTEESILRCMLMGPIVVDGAQSGGSHGGKQSGGFGWKGGKGDRERAERGPVAADSPVGPGDAGWSKESLPSNSRKGRAPAGPMPKKVVNDPLEKLTMELTAILNKITPQTFEKLSQTILETKLENTTQLDRLVEVIFEKAVQEPTFTFMYADLCALLKEKSNWVFYTIIKGIDQDPANYFWIRDFQFPEEAASFFSRAECMNAIAKPAEELPAMKPLTTTLQPESVEYLLFNNTLFRLGHNLTNNWFLTHVPFDEVDTDHRATTCLDTAEACKKDAIGEISFRGRLAHSCESEFASSVKNDNIDRLAQELKTMQEQRGTMPEDEFTAKTEAIEEERGRLKRRMLGNIRFVGELYKKKLLNTDTMHDCISELLGQPGEWKETYEDADLELLCRFLKTVGESLESKSLKSKNKPELGIKFNQYFDRMHALTKDKNINSRIRFAIEEVIVLRECNWQARREQEGPKKITEIHQQVQAEQTGKMVRQPSTGSMASTNSGRGGGNSGRRDTDDVRNRDGGRGGNRRDRDDRGDRRGGDRERDRGAARGGNSPMNQTSRNTAKPAPAAKEPITFDDSHCKNKVHSSIDEYMHGEDVAEVKAMLSEGKVDLVGYLLQELVDRYCNVSQASQKERVLKIFEDSDLLKSFNDHKHIVELALESCECFKTLVAMVCEVFDAPQRIAKIVSILIKNGVVKVDRILAMVETFKQYSVEQDFDTPDMIDTCYEKFKAALEA